ncbi:LPS export ABC transporter periplasmic protein LptC [Pigmentiphaga litoralis]|uniref:Lipopolysaccharide export system protein LptC n=1 Tax=Pigmentiphaga litoralis TaxID=516702 RepID=A0A7Y9IS58_9BURK|nr:LPS export ABC transporter periplasmic protein LptC [Pigmentiphaga litoralis]NYE24369.1 lipopolysaccharide export system protein LptC [Pigmentiphaga litoralis]NYE82017.1 lipopolysaccharide export system protein LptC [Pigmentiphaga litoralis]
MRDRLASAVSIILLVSLVAGTWWAADYAQRAVTTDPPRRLTHEIDSYVEDFVMVRSDPEGLPSTRMEGKRLVHYPDDDSSEVTQLRAVNQRADRPTTVVSSNFARMDEDGARIDMRGNVDFQRMAAQGRDALTIRSEQMTLRPDEDLAFTDQPATILNGRSRIQGRGMRYNNVTRELSIAQRTQVEITPGKSPAPRQP